MFRTKFIWWSLLSLFLVVVLAVGGYALYRLSWSQGYVAGQQITAPGVAPSVAPGIAPGLPYDFFPGGWIFSLLVFLFVIFIISRIVRTMFWLSAGPDMMAGWRRSWRRYPRHRHFYGGPWCYGWEDEESEKEPGAPEQKTAEA
jgi:hypothetical protein